MNIQEAYKIMGTSENSSDEELKEKYKKLAFEFHPDRNKDDPNKFKTINEAYQFIQDYKTNPSKHNPQAGPQYWRGVDFNDIFSKFGGVDNEQPKSINIPPPTINITITFKEAVLGTNKEIQYKKFIKCNACDGKGVEFISNGCTSCNGFGRVVSRTSGMMFTSTCNKCFGRNVKNNKCVICNSAGAVEKDNTATVHIPPGVLNNTMLRLQGAGHYAGHSFFGESYGHAFLQIKVEVDPELQLENSDVVSHLKLQLLDAITGCERDVHTIHGDKSITIPPMSKNKEEIKIPKCGILEANGVQRVILDIEYPSNIDALTNFLKSEN